MSHAAACMHVCVCVCVQAGAQRFYFALDSITSSAFACTPCARFFHSCWQVRGCSAAQWLSFWGAYQWIDQGRDPKHPRGWSGSIAFFLGGLPMD